MSKLILNNYPAPTIDADEIDYFLPILDGGKLIGTAVFGKQTTPGDDHSRKFLGVMSTEDDERYHDWKAGRREPEFADA